MSARTGTITAMESDSFLDRVFDTALGRILVVLLQTFLVSQALLSLFAVRQTIDVQVLKYTVVVIVGLAAGFSARRFLKGRSLLLKIVAALLAASLSLAVQYSLSSGFIGIQPFQRTGRYPDWNSLIQLGIAALGAALVVLAFRSRSKSSSAPAVSIQEPGTESTADSRPVPAAPISRVAVQAHPNKLVLDPPREIVKQPAAKNKKRKTLAIHFVGEEEHTCPYCLDRVEKDDPRGVKVCPICKTWHHADCWGITGACQIPHMHDG
jgi:hypothetical protein